MFKMSNLNYTNILKKLGYDENQVLEIQEEYESYLPEGIKIIFHEHNYSHVITKDYLREYNVDEILENPNNEILNFDFKVGEPIIYECDIYFVKEMINEHVGCVTETVTSSSMYRLNDSIFELSPQNYNILLAYKYTKEKLFDFSDKYSTFGGYNDCYDHLIDCWYNDTKNGQLALYDSCTNYIENQKNEYYGNNRPDELE